MAENIGGSWYWSPMKPCIARPSAASSSGGTGRVAITSPSASWELVVLPSSTVPSYSLSRPMRYWEIRVALPTRMTRSPVAIGSRVPACPMRFIRRIPRSRATTSCEVWAGGLSTRRTPSISFGGPSMVVRASAPGFFLRIHGGQAPRQGRDQARLEVGGRGLEIEPGRAGVAAAAKLRGDQVDAIGGLPRAQAGLDGAARPLLDQDADLHPGDAAGVVDQALRVLTR